MAQGKETHVHEVGLIMMPHVRTICRHGVAAPASVRREGGVQHFYILIKDLLHYGKKKRGLFLLFGIKNGTNFDFEVKMDTEWQKQSDFDRARKKLISIIFASRILCVRGEDFFS
jgi:hypothetical protein